jgi:hypothetical protein
MMKHYLATPVSAALVVLASAALAPLSRAAGDEVVAYKFSKPPVNSLGITSMEDLRGKPVLIDFWGTH